MQLTWLSLVPPLVVIGTMFIVQQLNISLVVGILTAALIAAQGHMISALTLCMHKLVEHFSDIDVVFLYTLLTVISSLIVLLTVTGSAAGCARIISKKMKTARNGEIATIMLAFLLSIDDYLSILTVGLVMSPMADRLAIVRTKLAYIVHALAGPLVIIVPISTWAAAILAQLNTAGFNQDETGRILADSFYVYIQTIPFIFYSLFTVCAVWLVVLTRIGFGSIGAAERNTLPDKSVTDVPSIDEEHHSLIELILPIVLLIGTVFFGILYAGGYHLFGGTYTFVDAFRHNNKTFLILLISSLVAFTSSIVVSRYKKLLALGQLPSIVREGFDLIKSAIVMVILASILGSFLRVELQTGSYIAHLLLDRAPLFLIPVLLFAASLIITLVTGSAWGAFSMLIPISTQMLMGLMRLTPPVTLDQIPLLFPVLGAVLSGAACGNHLSPFAETTIMTAASTGTDPIEHAKTQFLYAVPVIIGTIVSFVLAGLMVGNGWARGFLVPAGAGIAVTVLLLLWFAYAKNKLK